MVVQVRVVNRGYFVVLYKKQQVILWHIKCLQL